MGTFEITGPLGKGGMGEVYRARDTKLGRDVAIKTLPSALASDHDRLARFEREAKLLASLHHAHIASVFSLDEHDGTLYIAMELVEGVTLEEKLKAGPLPVEDALQLGLEIAEALEAAHEKGVVHRDLKPANIMITPDGVVKVLDFGLAKAFMGDPTEASPAHSPALSVAMTQQGLILGTAGYMSPEQASGQATDQRADIWAYGVVLYEMLTGMPLFSGESVPHVLADVLKSEPDWSRLPPNLHPRIRQLLERCLTKKPRNRYHSIAEARVDIQQVLSDPAGVEPAPVTLGEARPRSKLGRIGLPIATLTAGAAVAGIAVWLAVAPEPTPPPISRFEVPLPDGRELRVAANFVLDLSPDGRQFVLNTNDGLYLRRMDELEARLIPGTEDALYTPFFSADGRFVAYRQGNELRRISVNGGAPVDLTTDIRLLLGGDWAADGTILIGLPEGIVRASADGGVREIVVPAGPDETLLHPVMLPDGDSVLFTSAAAGAIPGAAEAADIVVGSLGSGERTVVFPGGYKARYLPTGHLVYVFEDSLFGVAFDIDTRSFSGGPVSLVDGVSNANYEIADDGTLIYLTGARLARAGDGTAALFWRDRGGQVDQEPFPSVGLPVGPRVSPNGNRVALSVATGSAAGVWVLDERGTLVPVTSAGLNLWPIWAPDGNRLVFTALDVLEARTTLYIKNADGTGEAERVLTVEQAAVRPSGWTPDGSQLLFAYGPPTSETSDVGIATVAEGDAWEPLLDSDAIESAPAVSPNGNWIAYSSDRTGRCEIFVERFPALGDRRQISTNGGAGPVWSPDGSELFFLEANRLMSVPIDYEAGFDAGTPTLVLDDFATQQCVGDQSYDISPDGQRFATLSLVVSGDEDVTEARIVVVQNWIEELKRRVPVE